MSNANIVLTGRIEDKWVEFVSDEFAEQRRRSRRNAGPCRNTMARVEVHARYLWLFAAALLAWYVC